MKDKELREKLEKIGIIHIGYNDMYAGHKIQEWLDYEDRFWLKEYAKRDVDKLKKDNEELQNTVRALMELLNVTVVEPEKGKKLKKGNKEVSLEPKK